jgi:protein SCO1
MKRLLASLLIAALGALLLSGCAVPFLAGEAKPLRGMAFQQPRQFDFQLTDTAGQPMRGSDLDGKVALVFFGYTFCPDICPTTMSDFKQVKEQLGSRADDVRFVMITVDPERDTPDRLGRYVASFDPSFIGLWGDAATIKQLTDTYGVVAERREVEGTAASYLIDHTSLAFLVDKQGMLRSAYPSGVTTKLLAEDVTTLLNE